MPRRILILTPLFGPEVKSAPLANELVAALIEQGHDVHVIVMDWSGQSGGRDASYRTPGGALVDVIAPPAMGGLRAMPFRLARAALGLMKGYRRARAVTRGRSYDRLFAFTIACALLGPLWATKARAGVRQVFMTDFYPFHNVAIGTLPPWLLRPGLMAEGFALRRFNRILCLSPEGARFLRSHYRPSNGSAIALLPLWTSPTPLGPVDSGSVRQRHHLPPARTVAVFGGHIGPGRGIDMLLEVARASAARLPDMLFLFVGSGPLLPDVERAAERDPERIALLRGLPHGEYMELLCACDIGLVSTVAEVEAPAFPSKSLDYLRAGLPIVAAVDAGSDFIATLGELEIGIGVAAGDGAAMIDALEQASRAEYRAGARQRAIRALETHFSARRAAAIVAGEAAPGSAARDG